MEDNAVKECIGHLHKCSNIEEISCHHLKATAEEIHLHPNKQEELPLYEELLECVHTLVNQDNNCTAVQLLDGGLSDLINALFQNLMTRLNGAGVSKSVECLVEQLLETVNVIANTNPTGKTKAVLSHGIYFLDLLCHGHLSFQRRMEVLKSTNMLLEQCPTKTKETFLKESDVQSKILSLVDLLKTIGDYEFQVGLLECLVRLFPKKYREKYARQFFQNSQMLEGFLSIKDSDFEMDCRYFLNDLNKCMDFEKRVYSIPCTAAAVGSKQLRKPCDSGYDQFWVDFNIGSQRITLFCEQDSLLSQGSQIDEDLWETVSVYKSDVDECSLNEIMGRIVLEMTMKQRVGELYPSQLHNDLDKMIKVEFILEFEPDIVSAVENTFNFLKKKTKVSTAVQPVKITIGNEVEEDSQKEGSSASVQDKDSVVLCSQESMSSSRWKVSVPIEPMRSQLTTPVIPASNDESHGVRTDVELYEKSTSSFCKDVKTKKMKDSVRKRKHAENPNEQEQEQRKKKIEKNIKVAAPNTPVVKKGVKPKVKTPVVTVTPPAHKSKKSKKRTGSVSEIQTKLPDVDQIPDSYIVDAAHIEQELPKSKYRNKKEQDDSGIGLDVSSASLKNNDAVSKNMGNSASIAKSGSAEFQEHVESHVCEDTDNRLEKDTVEQSENKHIHKGPKTKIEGKRVFIGETVKPIPKSCETQSSEMSNSSSESQDNMRTGSSQSIVKEIRKIPDSRPDMKTERQKKEMSLANVSSKCTTKGLRKKKSACKNGEESTRILRPRQNEMTKNKNQALAVSDDEEQIDSMSPFGKHDSLDEHTFVNDQIQPVSMLQTGGKCKNRKRTAKQVAENDDKKSKPGQELKQRKQKVAYEKVAFDKEDNPIEEKPVEITASKAMIENLRHLPNEKVPDKPEQSIQFDIDNHMNVQHSELSSNAYIKRSGKGNRKDKSNMENRSSDDYEIEAMSDAPESSTCDRKHQKKRTNNRKKSKTCKNNSPMKKAEKVSKEGNCYQPEHMLQPNLSSDDGSKSKTFSESSQNMDNHFGNIQKAACQNHLFEQRNEQKIIIENSSQSVYMSLTNSKKGWTKMTHCSQQHTHWNGCKPAKKTSRAKTKAKCQTGSNFCSASKLTNLSSSLKNTFYDPYDFEADSAASDGGEDTTQNKFTSKNRCRSKPKPRKNSSKGNSDSVPDFKMKSELKRVSNQMHSLSSNSEELHEDFNGEDLETNGINLTENGTVLTQDESTNKWYRKTNACISNLQVKQSPCRRAKEKEDISPIISSVLTPVAQDYSPTREKSWILERTRCPKERKGKTYVRQKDLNNKAEYYSSQTDAEESDVADLCVMTRCLSPIVPSLTLDIGSPVSAVKRRKQRRQECHSVTSIPLKNRTPISKILAREESEDDDIVEVQSNDQCTYLQNDIDEDDQLEITSISLCGKGIQTPMKFLKDLEMDGDDSQNDTENDENCANQLALCRSQDAGFVSGPSSTQRPSKSSLKRKYLDETEGDDTEESFQLSEDDVEVVPEMSRLVSKRLFVKDNYDKQIELRSVSQFTDSTCCDKDVEIQMPAYGTDISDFIHSFLLDKQSQMRAKKQRIETLTKESMKVSQSQFNTAWRRCQLNRCRTLDNYEEQLTLELRALERDIRRVEEAEVKTEVFFNDQMKLLQNCHESQNERLANMKALQRSLKGHSRKLLKENVTGNMMLQQQLKNNIQTLQRKLLQENQQHEMANVRRGLQSLL